MSLFCYAAIHNMCALNMIEKTSNEAKPCQVNYSLCCWQ